MRIDNNRRPSRRAMIATLAVTLALVTLGIVTNTRVAHADSIVYTQQLVSIPAGSNIPLPTDPDNPGCTHIPGLTQAADAHADTYVSDTLGRYEGLKVSFTTSYRKSTAVAATAYRDSHAGASPTCKWLLAYDNMTTFATMKAVGCGSTVPAAQKPATWCTAAKLTGASSDPMLDLNLDDCRMPKWNDGIWGGELQVATWHNQHVKVATIDVLKKLDLSWMPGHFNLDVYAEDWDILAGLDPNANIPGQWTGFGKTPTLSGVEEWARFEKAVVNAFGLDYNTLPISGREYVFNAAVAGNLTETINLWPDVPSKSKVETVQVGDYRDHLFEKECNLSPWVADAVGDGFLSPTGIPREPVITEKSGVQCDTGVRAPLTLTGYNPSAHAIGQDFIAMNEVQGPVSQDEIDNADTIAPLLWTMYENTDTQNHMVLRDGDPINANPFCSTQLDLGVSRGRQFDGTIDDNAKDPHFANFIGAT